MKVFFAASPRGMKTLEEEYNSIYEAIESSGHENISDLAIVTEPEEHYSLPDKKIIDHYKKVINLVREADVVLIEGSTPSLAMGYLADKALERSKPVIILHTEGHEPFFLTAIEDDKAQVIEYSLKTIEKEVVLALEYAQNQMDTRFNFFISPRIGNYLDWIAKNKKTPRAVYLRELIEEEMKKNKEFRG